MRARDDIGCGAGADTVTAGLATPSRSTARRSRASSRTTRSATSSTSSRPRPSRTASRTAARSWPSSRSAAHATAAAPRPPASPRRATPATRGGRAPPGRDGLVAAGGLVRALERPVRRLRRPALDVARRSLVLGDDGTGIVVSRSGDGASWGAPVVAARVSARAPTRTGSSATTGRPAPAAGRATSPTTTSARDSACGRRGTARHLVRRRRHRRARDPRSIVNGAMPVVRRDGTLVVLYSVFELDRRRSTNRRRSVDRPRPQLHGSCRRRPLQSEDVSGLAGAAVRVRRGRGDGTIWAAWSDCRFVPDCDANDIALISSTDGVRWSAPIRVPAFPTTWLRWPRFLPVSAWTRRARERRRAWASSTTRCRRPGCFGFTCATADVYFVDRSTPARRGRGPCA